jgi:hypothetical protein
VCCREIAESKTKETVTTYEEFSIAESSTATTQTKGWWNKNYKMLRKKAVKLGRNDPNNICTCE